MTVVLTVNVEALRTVMTGAVLTPSDPGYHQARSIWNGQIDRRPAVIAMCRSAADVVEAIAFGRKNALEITVRGGGHNFAGTSICDDGLMIHLGEMREVSVDPTARRVRVGGGTTLGEMDVATQAHGLATTGGTVSHTGVAGLTLGGGMGWLTRKFGLAVDNLVSAQVVTADGRILTASATENADLYWAIRGGGGNFGVVTQFEFALHEVGPSITFGLCFWGLDQGTAVLRLVEELYADLPRDLNIVVAALNAPPAPFVPEAHHFQPGFALLVAGFGSEQEHASLLERIRTALPPLFEFATPMPYVQLQQVIDGGNEWGSFGYEKGLYLEHLNDDAIQVLAEQATRRTSPLSTIAIFRTDGAYCDPGDDDTSFSGARTPRYAVVIMGIASDAETLSVDRTWVRATWEALRPHATGIGFYVNALEEASGEKMVTASYGAKYDRLAGIKAIYDPSNVFHHNVNIVPAT
jgi:FAD/FMN-containing dehydrogenase